ITTSLSFGPLRATDALAGGGSFSAGQDALNSGLGRVKRKGVSKTVQSVAAGPTREISPVKLPPLLDADS
ncbi:MAG: hypothetical protein VXZ92_01700, partial [SAR324 cluster bacterium]|nr:hypothetical protein [SAR324 cluster bacterium]